MITKKEKENKMRSDRRRNLRKLKICRVEWKGKLEEMLGPVSSA